MKAVVSVAVVAVVLLAALRLGKAPLREAEATDAVWNEADWEALETTTRWALSQGLDTVPLGEAMAALGQRFVGTPYVPHTLEGDGPERLVINLTGLDCVTLVENVFTLARFAREPGTPELLGDQAAAQRRYEELLQEVRYRGGVLDGYPSRLHYFSDWIRDNAARGLVEDVTLQLGGEPETEPVTFMSANPQAYPALADSAAREAIRATEEGLSGSPRFRILEAGIAGAASGIRNGDIIAATSTVPGLDVAHTGLALWVGGALHLLHAPLVGSEVQVSERTLARRILDLSGQDGILVARPVVR